MKRNELSIQLIRSSIWLYVLWLLLPAVQTTGRAMTGALCVGLFGLGVLLDAPTLRKQWPWLLARAACAAVMPLLLRRVMDRGGENAAGFYVQQAMFWFPLVYAGHVRTVGDRRLWQGIGPVLLGATVLTLLSTSGWLMEGMFLRGDKVYAYSRSLGCAEPGNEAYLRELMLKNIGGYDFIYAMAAALPLCCIGVAQSRGWKRAAFVALIALQTVTIVLSQYTYAMLYAAGLLALEVLALLVRLAFGRRVSLGGSLLAGLVPLLAALLLMQPLLRLAGAVCAQLGLVNFAFSFEQLGLALQGSATDANSRLSHYLVAVEGIRRSPLWGSLWGSERLMSYHSDLLDLLSGAGLLGALVAGGMIWLMGRGSLRGLGNHPQRAQIVLSLMLVGVTALLGTVVYSRDIPAVVMLGALCVLEQPVHNEKPGVKQ